MGDSMDKIKFKKTGFTLIELLAVIAILAVILVIAIPNVMNSITTSYEKTYEYNLKALKSAAKDYVIDNGIRLDNTEQKIINISKIVEDGYIKEVKDPETKEDCEGFVTVTKDDHNYKYDSYLMIN
jgi:prepilin-type N-terminal cleavage/methylation domain-containing protein